MTNAKSKSFAFSILEIPIAMTVLTIGLLFLFGVFPTSFQGVSKGKNILSEAQIAEQIMQEALSESFTTNQSTSANVSAISTLNGVSSTTAYSYTVTDYVYLSSCSGGSYTAGTTPCPLPAPPDSADTTAKLQAAQKKDIEVFIQGTGTWGIYRYVTRVAR